MKTLAIVGAGMAGLSCARALAGAGWTVRLFDKARSPGGRMATRRLALPGGGEVSFDHGAQFVTARDPIFLDLCETLRAGGAAHPYPWPVTGRPDGGSRPDNAPRFAGVPGMNAIPKALARGLDIALERTVTAVNRSASGWRVGFQDGSQEDGFDAAVLAVPADQAAPLLGGVRNDFAREAIAARLSPCWAGLYAFEGGSEGPLSALRIDDGGPIGWLAPTGDRRGWVAHATPDWSRLNLEADAGDIAARLEAALRRLAPRLGETRIAQAHRWRYALARSPAATPFAWDGAERLGVCGDWRIGPSVESAWRSGAALADAIGPAGAL